LNFFQLLVSVAFADLNSAGNLDIPWLDILLVGVDFELEDVDFGESARFPQVVLYKPFHENV